MPISVRGSSDVVSEWHSRAVIDLALRLGEAMLVTGASVADTTAAVLRVCRAYGLRSVHADITYTSITLSMHRGVYRDPITVMRIISRFGTDYSRLEALHTLVREIAQNPGEPGDVEDNLDELDRILEMPSMYRRGVITAAIAGLGGAVAALLGGSVFLIILTTLTAAVIDRLQHWIAHRGVSAFFGQVAGAMVPAVVAVVLFFAKQHFPDVGWLRDARPSFVAAAGVVVLLAGMSVVTAAQDTLDGFYVTASARTYEVMLMTSGVVAGVLAVLTVAKRAGVDLNVVGGTSLAHAEVVRVVAAAVIGGTFAISAYCGPVAVLVGAAAGGVSWALYDLAVSFHATTPVASGIAAFCIGVLAPRTAKVLHVPSISITAAGIVPLLPGSAVFRGILLFLADHTGTRMVPTLLEALLIGLALAVGVSLGTLLGRQLMTNTSSIMGTVLRRTVQETGD